MMEQAGAGTRSRIKQEVTTAPREVQAAKRKQYRAPTIVGGIVIRKTDNDRSKVLGKLEHNKG